MRINISFYSKEKFLIPIHYNYLIQGFIYNNIDPKLADFLHKKGFKNSNRSFKLFSFSRINGDIEIVKMKNEYFLLIKGIFNFTLSSPFEEFIESFAMNLAKSNSVLSLDNNEVQIYSVDVLFEPEISIKMNIRMISPITVYSTLKDPLGNKKTYYYNPWEKEFNMLIKSNLVGKMIAYDKFLNKRNKLKEKDYDDLNLINIKPVKVNKNNEKIINYKGTIIKAWFGKYLLEGKKEFIKMAYDCGLGSKNSQGFGLFEIMN